ncbi:MAG: tRNA hydroxylase [Flaviaesturariibacter sp.]|nr:tRNA hydroxylase [Flaviaesturariibacter sp.]
MGSLLAAPGNVLTQQVALLHRRQAHLMVPSVYFCPMDASPPLSADARSILGLQLPTDPRWVNLAALSLEEVLSDHAYCEQKAAITCISLIQRYSRKEKLVNSLAPIVTEEWGHFRMVLAELQKRGLPLGNQRKDEYVAALFDYTQKGGGEEGRLLDQLLMMAMIEARSCERFKRLSEGLDDDYLRKFYRRFMESEAGHYTLFIELAETYIEKEKVQNRWKEWLAYEAEVMKKMEVRGDRIH